jgi:hypothetical protein
MSESNCNIHLHVRNSDRDRPLRGHSLVLSRDRLVIDGARFRNLF